MIMPPLKGLYAFEAIVRKGSYKEAAEELCVSRSAISHQIKKLEELLEVRLFQRDKPGISLTDAGRLLYENLDGAFDQIRRSLAAVEALVGEQVVAVALPPYFAVKWLLPRLPAFRQRYPTLELHLSYPAKSVDVLDPQIHILIKWMHRDQADPHARRLVDGALVPACSARLLTGRDRISEPADLGRTTLLHELDERYWAEWLEKAGQKGLQPQRNETFEDSNVLYQAALEGQGVALICPSLAAEEIGSGALVCPFDISLNDYGYYATVGPAYRNHAPVNRIIDWLCNHESRGTD